MAQVVDIAGKSYFPSSFRDAVLLYNIIKGRRTTTNG
jgi:hypothetical protein